MLWFAFPEFRTIGLAASRGFELRYAHPEFSPGSENKDNEAVRSALAS